MLDVGLDVRGAGLGMLDAGLDARGTGLVMLDVGLDARGAGLAARAVAGTVAAAEGDVVTSTLVVVVVLTIFPATGVPRSEAASRFRLRV